MYYSITATPDGTTMTVILSDGESLNVSDSDRNFEELRDYLLNPGGDYDEEYISELAHTATAIAERIRKVSDRVSVAGNALYFDGDQIDDALSETILDMYGSEKDSAFSALVNFLEKLYTNPQEESRTSLYEWIVRYGLRILPSGNFTAYKGVKIGAGGESLSINTGVAYVDGIRHSGAIPNPTGAVIEMPRSLIDANTLVGCSVGLHAGTWEYASAWAQGRVVLVEINPRDVVSVPSDCEFQKLRVSRYTVLEEIDHKIDIVEEYCELYSDNDEDEAFLTENDVRAIVRNRLEEHEADHEAFDHLHGFSLQELADDISYEYVEYVLEDFQDVDDVLEFVDEAYDDFKYRVELSYGDAYQ